MCAFFHLHGITDLQLCFTLGETTACVLQIPIKNRWSFVTGMSFVLF